MLLGWLPPPRKDRFVTTSILILPGLGDEKTHSQIQYLTRLWGGRNRRVFIFQPKWSEPESYDKKIKRLENFYAEHTADHTVIVGYSAGGALATILLYKHPTITKAYLISAKLQGSSTIGASFDISAPAFRRTVERSESLLSEISPQKVMCLVPLHDEVVPKKDMQVPKAAIKRVWFAYHMPSIVVALIFNMTYLLRKNH